MFRDVTIKSGDGNKSQESLKPQAHPPETGKKDILPESGYQLQDVSLNAGMEKNRSHEFVYSDITHEELVRAIDSGTAVALPVMMPSLDTLNSMSITGQVNLILSLGSVMLDDLIVSGRGEDIYLLQNRLEHVTEGIQRIVSVSGEELAEMKISEEDLVTIDATRLQIEEAIVRLDGSYKRILARANKLRATYDVESVLRYLSSSDRKSLPQLVAEVEDWKMRDDATRTEAQSVVEQVRYAVGVDVAVKRLGAVRGALLEFTLNPEEAVIQLRKDAQVYLAIERELDSKPLPWRRRELESERASLVLMHRLNSGDIERIARGADDNNVYAKIAIRELQNMMDTLTREMSAAIRGETDFRRDGLVVETVSKLLNLDAAGFAMGFQRVHLDKAVDEGARRFAIAAVDGEAIDEFLATAGISAGVAALGYLILGGGAVISGALGLGADTTLAIGISSKFILDGYFLYSSVDGLLDSKRVLDLARAVLKEEDAPAPIFSADWDYAGAIGITALVGAVVVGGNGLMLIPPKLVKPFGFSIIPKKLNVDLKPAELEVAVPTEEAGRGLAVKVGVAMDSKQTGRVVAKPPEPPSQPVFVRHNRVRTASEATRRPFGEDLPTRSVEPPRPGPMNVPEVGDEALVGFGADTWNAIKVTQQEFDSLAALPGEPSVHAWFEVETPVVSEGSSLYAMTTTKLKQLVSLKQLKLLRGKLVQTRVVTVPVAKVVEQTVQVVPEVVQVVEVPAVVEETAPELAAQTAGKANDVAVGRPWFVAEQSARSLLDPNHYVAGYFPYLLTQMSLTADALSRRRGPIAFYASDRLLQEKFADEWRMLMATTTGDHPSHSRESGNPLLPLSATPWHLLGVQNDDPEVPFSTELELPIPTEPAEPFTAEEADSVIGDPVVVFGEPPREEGGEPIVMEMQSTAPQIVPVATPPVVSTGVSGDVTDVSGGGGGARAEGLTIGEALVQVRNLFLRRGLSEARVSLRQAKLIRVHIDTFAPTQGIVRATIGGMWQMLAVGLPKTEREGELGSEIRDIIKQMRIQNATKDDVWAELDGVVQLKPTDFDASADVSDQIWRAAAGSDKALGKLDVNARIRLMLLIDEAEKAIDYILGTHEDDRTKVSALGKIGSSPNFGGTQLVRVIDYVLDAQVNPLTKASAAVKKIGKNPNLDIGQLRRLISYIFGNQLDDFVKIDVLKEIATNPNLDGTQLRGIIDYILDARVDILTKLSAIGQIGENPSLGSRQLRRLIDYVLVASADDAKKISALGRIVINPNLSRTQITRVIDYVSGARTSNLAKLSAIGQIGESPSLDVSQLKRLIDYVLGSPANNLAKLSAIKKIGKHRNLKESQLTNFIDYTLGVEEANDAKKADTIVGIANNPNLGETQLAWIINYILVDASADDWAKVLAIGEIGKNPNLSIIQLRRLIDFVFGTWVNNDKKMDVIGEIGKNPKLGVTQLQGLIDYVLKASVDDAEKISALEKIGGNPDAKPLIEAIRSRFLAIKTSADSIKAQTADGAVRVFSGDLDENLRVLAGVLRKAPGSKVVKSPAANVLPDFDPTLVTAYQLLNRLVQALAVGRFVLISGPPVSGKSEVGKYLKEILGWDANVVGGHRYTSQEDLMQRIGVVSNGSTSFVVVDGPLADALINGKLFILNEINLPKPGDLSFLFSILADVNQEFNYYDATLGRVVRRKINPAFRAIGTQNREGAGRKEINAALANRAIEIDAPEYGRLELIALLQGKYPQLAEKYGRDFSATLVDFYSDVALKIEARAIAGGSEGYVWNLRHLMRLAEGFIKAQGENGRLTPQTILQTIYDRVGASLALLDREPLYDAIVNYIYNGVTVDRIRDVDEFKKRLGGLKLRDVYDELGIDAVRAGQLAAEMGIKDIPTTARFLRAVIMTLQAGYHPWLKGPAGTGKTVVADFAARLIGANTYNDTLTQQTDDSKLKGELKPVLFENPDGTRRLGFKHVPSELVKALRDKSARLSVAILDEAAFARPDVLEELNSVLDRDGGIWVVSEDGKRIEFIQRQENFRLVLVSNTYGYSGVQLQSPAFRSRTQELYLDFEYLPEELAEIFVSPEIGRELALSLGRTVLDVRKLFIENGLSEARVSLRQVNQIKEYVHAFSPTQGLQRAVMNALWMMLGAGLKRELRQGLLGAGLRRILPNVEIPGYEKASTGAALASIIQAKPTTFDPSLNVEEQTWKAAAGDDRLIGEMGFAQKMKLLNLLISRHDETRFEQVFEYITDAEIDDNTKITMLEELGQNRELIPGQLGRLIHYLQISEFAADAKLRMLGEISHNTVLLPEQLDELVDYTMDIAVDPHTRARALSEIGQNPRLSAPQLDRIISYIMGTELSDSSKVEALGKIGENPALSPEQFGRIIDYILDHEISVYVDTAYWELYGIGKNPGISPDQLGRIVGYVLSDDAFDDEKTDAASRDSIRVSVLKEWCLNPALSPEQSDEMVKLILASGVSVKTKVGVLGEIGQNLPFPDRLGEFIDYILASKTDDITKVAALGDIGRNPKLAGRLGEIFDYVLGARVDEAVKVKALGMIGQNTNLAPDQLSTIFDYIRGAEVTVDKKFHQLGDICHNPKFPRERLDELVNDVLGTEIGDPAKALVLGAIGRNPNLPPELRGRLQDAYNGLMERLGAGELLQQLTYDTPLNAPIKEMLYRRFRAIKARADALSASSAHSAAVVPVSDGSVGHDLPDNLRVLARILRESNPAINAGPEIRPHDDYNYTLVSAYQLLNRVIQALAINRVALVSGPPATGKSEVGKFLAGLLNWQTRIVNGSRYTSEEDMMQKIGVIPNSDETFTVVDGPVADALLYGKLLIFDEINLTKPGSLAFLFSILADVNHEFNYYDPTAGRVVRRKISKGFRVIATQNREGAGRKELNAALANRAIEIDAPAYGRLELVALLQEKYPQLDQGHGQGLSATLVNFYDDVALKMRSRAMSGGDEGYVWNLRHLMRLAEGFAGSTVLTPPTILQTIYDRVGIMLRPEDRDVFYDAVQNYEYAGVAVGPSDVEAFKKQQEKLTFGEVLAGFGIDPAATRAEMDRRGIEDIPASARFMRAILTALKSEKAYHPWLKGPAGTGKTELAAMAVSLLGGTVFGDTLTPQTDESRLKGEIRPVMMDDGHGGKRLGFKYVPRALINGLREAWRLKASGRLVATILDEAAFARPDVLEELNALLDREGGIWVISEDGRTQEFLRRSPNFRLILASNIYGYSGINLQSEAFRSRMFEIYMGFEFRPQDLAKIFRSAQIGGPLAAALGQFLYDVRDDFIKQGQSEARISLRQVKQIKRHIEKFGGRHGTAKAVMMAIWLVLGAGLKKEEREGKLGRQLRDRILAMDIPGTTAEGRAEILGKMVQAKPVSYNVGLNVDAIWQAAAGGDKFFEEMNLEQRGKFLAALISGQDDVRSRELIDYIIGLDVDDDTKVEGFGNIYEDQNPPPGRMREIVDYIIDSEADPNVKVVALGKVGRNVNIPYGMLDELAKYILGSEANDFTKASAIENIGSNAGLSPGRLREFIDYLIETESVMLGPATNLFQDRFDNKKKVSVLAEIGQNPRLSPDQIHEIVNVIISTDASLNEKVDGIIKISRNPALAPESADILVDYIMGTGVDDETKVWIFGNLGKGLPISSGKLSELANYILGVGIEVRLKLWPLGAIGQSPNFPANRLSELVDYILMAKVINTTKFDAINEIGRNPEIPSDRLARVINYVQSAKVSVSDDTKVSALGTIGENTAVAPNQLGQFIDYILATEASTANKIIALKKIGQNPNLTPAQFGVLFGRIMESAIGYGLDEGVNAIDEIGQKLSTLPARLGEIAEAVLDYKDGIEFRKVVTLGKIGRHSNLPQIQLDKIVDYVLGVHIVSHIKTSVLGEIGQNSHLSPDQLSRFIDYIQGARSDASAEIIALEKIARNPSLPPGLHNRVQAVYGELLEKLGIDEALLQLNEDTPLNIPVREDLYRRFRAIRMRADTMAVTSADSAVLISSSDDSDLQNNLEVLASILHEANPEINPGPTVEIDDDFNPFLVTANQLTNRVAQAFAISRFAIVRGPSGSGKTEVGRYIASRLGWTARVINGNRYTSEDDLMQKIGVIANGETSFVVTNGVLAKAMLKGELVVFNEFNLPKPGNLSFLFGILADGATTFSYYDVDTGRIIENMPIHPNFRVLATENYSGAGRKESNPALSNRAIPIDAPAYSKLELAAMLGIRYPGLEEKYGAGFAMTLVNFYDDMAYKIASSSMREHAEGYSWNLRHLMRLAEGFIEVSPPLMGGVRGGWQLQSPPPNLPHQGGGIIEGEHLTPQTILQVMYDRIGVSFRPSDRDAFFDAVMNHEYGSVTITPTDVQEFVQSQDRATLEGVYKEFGIDMDMANAEAARRGIRDVPTTARFLRAIIGSIRMGYNPWLKGPAGTGKTDLAEFAARITGSNIYLDTLTPQTDEAQLKGEMRPVIFRQADGRERLGFKHVPSPLVDALRDRSGRPVIAMLDEAAFARPDIIDEFNTLLDRDGGIWVISEDGRDPEFLERGPNFRLVLASNTYGYGGVQLQSDAFRSRMHEIYMDFEFNPREIDIIMGNPDVSSSSGRGGSGRKIHVTATVTPQTPQTQIQQTAPQGQSVADDELSKMLGVGEAVPPVEELPARSLQFMTRQLSSGPESAPDTRFHIFDSPIRKKLREAGARASEDVIRRLEERYEELKRRLQGAAVSIARDATIVVEFDPETETATINPIEPRVFKIGPNFLLNMSIEDLITIAQHEGEHAELTRIGSGFFFGSYMREALIGAADDIRVNARLEDRAPGRREIVHDLCRRYYHDELARLSTDEIPQLLPHEAFLSAILMREYGGTSLWDSDPLVGPALQEAWAGIQKAKAERPVAVQPDAVTVDKHFFQFEQILKDKVYPIYERLYGESLRRIERMLKDGAAGGQGQQGGVSRGGRPKIDIEDLSEEARKILEERARKIAGTFAPKGAQGRRHERARDIFGEDKKGKAGQSAGLGKDGKKVQGRSEGERYEPGSLGEALARQRAEYLRQQQELSSRTYSKFLAALGNLPDRVFQVFDQLLKPNTDFEYGGYFTSGPRIDVRRAILAINGLLATLRVFKRKVEPTAKDYRLSLLLDASGSMADHGVRELGGLGLASMFVDVFERLDLPYSLDAFHDGYIPLRGFGEKLKTVDARNTFFNNLVLNHWGGPRTDILAGLKGSLKRILEERRVDPRDQEFLFVLTDGEENAGNGAEIRKLCELAARQGIIVVGIGIGAGMSTVREHFPIHLTEESPENLPNLLAEFIKEYVKSQQEEE